jgi:Ca-activated chloride channel family protein
MSFIWPPMLLSLLLVPCFALAYLWVIRRRDAGAAQLLGTMRLTEGASGRRAGWRRHLPPAIFLAAITLLLAALARPTMVVALPHMEGTVILAFDVSTSMTADDLKPSRMDAAKRAARTFVQNQPSTIKVGIVAFSDSAFIVQQPTNVKADLLAAIDRLAPQGGTSLSEGMFTSLGAIAGKPIVVDKDATEEDLLALNIGYFGSAVIVMLSDGEHLSRVDPLQVAQVAANAGVRVFPIGIGSPNGTTLDIDGYHVATALNEPLLTEIAKATDGSYFRAEDEAKLAKVYDTIDLKLTVRGKETEVTSFVASAAILLLYTGAGLTMLWFGRVP